MSYYGIVAQGDTPDAGDCCKAYSKLSAKYGSSNVQVAGFNPPSTTPSTNHASNAHFTLAANFHVLYWSSHGSSSPALNVIDGPLFYSYTTAYNSWRNTSNWLKVPIIAACYQFDGSTNRHNWANNIMRFSDIRAMCGYHDMAPGTGTDTSIANDFFNLCCAGTTGNSVMYSWKNANAAYTAGSNYIILVYYDNNRCYYRLPGFSTVTYPDPNRSTTKIYRYTQANPNGAEVPKSMSVTINSAPYSLNLSSNACRSINLSKWNPAQVVQVGVDSDTFFYGQREYSMNPVSSKQGRSFNEELLNDLVGTGLLESASLKIYDDAMAEVPQDNSQEEDIVIGSTTQVFQHYNGIILEGNCFAACSDATGVISLTNRYKDYSVSDDVDHINLIHKEKDAFVEHFKKKFYLEKEVQPTIKIITPIYMRVEDKYILHYRVVFENKQHILIDAKVID
ncbi:MAG: hypothetical protein MJ098_01695 [Saccharofermentans sp.]|nr:hypothetical protein [Saccharofermentans sp.]